MRRTATALLCVVLGLGLGSAGAAVARVQVGPATPQTPRSVTLTVGRGQLLQFLEEASRVAGASDRTTFRRIFVPLLTPALFAAAIYSFMTSLESLEIPMIIGSCHCAL